LFPADGNFFPFFDGEVGIAISGGSGRMGHNGITPC
jgi:hypothetical protein